MIKVNDRFEFEKDTYGWKLHDWSDGVNPKTKEPTRTKRTTYHPNVIQVCNAVIDREAGGEGISDLDYVLMAITNARDELLEAIDTLSQEEGNDN